MLALLATDGSDPLVEIGEAPDPLAAPDEALSPRPPYGTCTSVESTATRCCGSAMTSSRRQPDKEMRNDRTSRQ